MAEMAGITAQAQTANGKGSIYEALGYIDKVNWMLALIDDITDHTEEIHLEGDAVLGFKQTLLDARDGLKAARNALEPIVHRVPHLDRARASAD